MTKHKHPDFASDLYLLFETIGAQLTICRYTFLAIPFFSKAIFGVPFFVCTLKFFKPDKSLTCAKFIFTCYVNAVYVIILVSSTEKNVVTMQEFLNVDMTGKIILNILCPPLSEDYNLVTYKVR